MTPFTSKLTGQTYTVQYLGYSAENEITCNYDKNDLFIGHGAS